MIIMKRIYAFLLVATMICAANAQVKGDFDGDNKVTIQDITELINIYLEQSEGAAGYKAIDLGLSVKWANMNVGATAPEEAGNYYAWAWPNTLELYSVVNCPWLGDWGRSVSTYNDFKKYCTNGAYGDVDDKTQIELQDDAAYVNIDTTWRMPTLVEAQELLDNCTWECVTQNEMAGFLVTGPNGNSIFLPAAGVITSRMSATEVSNKGTQGCYWTSTLNNTASSQANAFYFWSTSWNTTHEISSIFFRDNGMTIRGVQRNDITIEEKPVEGDIDGDGSVTVEDIVMLIDIYLNEETGGSSYQAVDLGLSVKWANMNVGATAPEEYGDFYAWGYPVVPEGYSPPYCPWLGPGAKIDSQHYKYDAWQKYCTKSNMGVVDGKTVVEPQDDAAYVNMGTTWRTPSLEEAQELIDNCTWEKTTLNGVSGFQVTGPNGNSIFLPTGGCFLSFNNGTWRSDYQKGVVGYYWLNSIAESVSNGNVLLFYESYGNITKKTGLMMRDCGLTIRAVKQ